MKNNSKIQNWENIRFRGENIGRNQYNLNFINYNDSFNQILNQANITDDLRKETIRRKEFTERTIKLLEGETVEIEKDSH